MKLIDKDVLVAEIDNRIKKYILLQQKPEMSDLQKELQDKIDCLNSIKGYILNTLEVKTSEMWHLQVKDSIYDFIKDWGLYSFVCLMNDGSVQKFTGTLCECADGTINTHVEAINDSYNVDDIIFWIETPL